MRGLYNNFKKQDSTIKTIIELVVVYGVSAILTYSAQRTGEIAFSVEGYLSFEVSTFIGAILLPIAMLFCLLIQLIPPIIGINLFLAYKNTFSKNKEILRVVPISNKRHIIKIISFFVVISVVYLLITMTPAFSLNNEMLASINDYFFSILFKIVISVVLSTSCIIVDIFCRESKIDGLIRWVWIGLTIFVVSSLWMYLSEIGIAIEILIGIVLLTIIFELYYILKEIENIKIN